MAGRLGGSWGGHWVGPGEVERPEENDEWRGVEMSSAIERGRTFLVSFQKLECFSVGC